MEQTEQIEQINQIVEANFEFGISLLKALDQADSPSSVIVSPISVLGALSQLNLGAQNETLEEISKVFGPDKTVEEISEHYGPIVLLLQQKKKDANNLFVAANKIFYNKDYIKAISPRFLRLTKKYYGVNSLESLDFAQAEASAMSINKFVFLSTKHKINNVVVPNELKNRNIPIVLINAVYISVEFFVRDVKEEVFFMGEGKGNIIQIEQMHWADKFGYFEDEQVKVIRMGYKEGSAFMYVILPAQPFGLDNVLQSINGKMVQKWVENTAENDEIKIEVQLPKFKTESTHSNLDWALFSIGLQSMFNTSTADFSGISSEKIWVGSAIQKALIKVDEKGNDFEKGVSESATPRSRSVNSAPKANAELKQFTANHPFLYVVVDKEGNLLFVGIFRGTKVPASNQAQKPSTSGIVVQPPNQNQKASTSGTNQQVVQPQNQKASSSGTKANQRKAKHYKHHKKHHSEACNVL